MVIVNNEERGLTYGILQAVEQGIYRGAKAGAGVLPKCKRSIGKLRQPKSKCCDQVSEKLLRVSVSLACRIPKEWDWALSKLGDSGGFAIARASLYDRHAVLYGLAQQGLDAGADQGMPRRTRWIELGTQN